MKHPETIMDVGDEIAYFGTNENGVFNSRWMALMGYQCDMFGIQLAIQKKSKNERHVIGILMENSTINLWRYGNITGIDSWIYWDVLTIMCMNYDMCEAAMSLEMAELLGLWRSLVQLSISLLRV